MEKEEVKTPEELGKTSEEVSRYLKNSGKLTGESVEERTKGILNAPDDSSQEVTLTQKPKEESIDAFTKILMGTEDRLDKATKDLEKAENKLGISDDTKEKGKESKEQEKGVEKSSKTEKGKDAPEQGKEDERKDGDETSKKEKGEDAPEQGKEDERKGGEEARAKVANFNLPSGMRITQDGPNWTLVSNTNPPTYTNINDVMKGIDDYNRKVDEYNAINSVESGVQNVADDKLKEKTETDRVNDVVQALPAVKDMEGKPLFEPKDLQAIAEIGINPEEAVRKLNNEVENQQNNSNYKGDRAVLNARLMSARDSR